MQMGHQSGELEQNEESLAMQYNKVIRTLREFQMNDDVTSTEHILRELENYKMLTRLLLPEFITTLSTQKQLALVHSGLLRDLKFTNEDFITEQKPHLSVFNSKGKRRRTRLTAEKKTITELTEVGFYALSKDLYISPVEDLITALKEKNIAKTSRELILLNLLRNCLPFTTDLLADNLDLFRYDNFDNLKLLIVYMNHFQLDLSHILKSLILERICFFSGSDDKDFLECLSMVQDSRLRNDLLLEFYHFCGPDAITEAQLYEILSQFGNEAEITRKCLQLLSLQFRSIDKVQFIRKVIELSTRMISTIIVPLSPSTVTDTFTLPMEMIEYMMMGTRDAAVLEELLSGLLLCLVLCIKQCTNVELHEKLYHLLSEVYFKCSMYRIDFSSHYLSTLKFVMSQFHLSSAGSSSSKLAQSASSSFASSQNSMQILSPSSATSDSNSLSKSDVYYCNTKMLALLLTKCEALDRQLSDELIKCFILGLAKFPPGRHVPSLNSLYALQISLFSSLSSVQRTVPSLLTRLSQLVTDRHLGMHVLEFLLFLFTSQRLNLMKDEYMLLFGISCTYIEISFPLVQSSVFSQYVMHLAFTVVKAWFSVVKEKKYFMEFICSRLSVSGELVDLLVDYLGVQVYGQALMKLNPASLNSTEVIPETFVCGNGIVCVQDKSVCIRRPSGIILQELNAGESLQDVFASNSLLFTSPKDNSSLKAVKPSPEIMRSLAVLDHAYCVDLHKVACVYLDYGQTNEREVLLNRIVSDEYAKFISFLGESVRTADCQGEYTAGLSVQDTESLIRFVTPWSITVFHVAHEIQSQNPDPDDLYIQRKRHLGNDFATIVWNDSGRIKTEFKIQSQFSFVRIVITPIQERMFHLRLDVREGMEMPGLMSSDTYIASLEAVAGLVRQVAINITVYAQVYMQLESKKSKDSVSASLLAGEYVSNPHERLKQIKNFIDKFVSSTKQIIVKYEDNVISRILRNYHHPSIVFYKGKWIGAVRGSNLGQCQGFDGLIKSTLQYIRQSHWNEIVIGEITSSFGYSSEGYFDLNPQLRLSSVHDENVDKELPSFQGHLDPRLIVFGDDLYMTTSQAVDGHLSMFLTQLRVNSEYTKELQFDELRPEDRIQINFTENPKEEHMNWMYIPNDKLRYMAPRYNEQFHKEFKSDDGMYFVSELEPLRIVKVFPQNGTAVTVFKSRSQNLLTAEYQNLRGSTNLVFNEEMNAFIGIAHEQDTVAQETIIPLKVHHNRLFSLEFIENEWKITWISNPFGMSSRFSSKKASERITSPVSFVDYKDSYIISFGEMECTSHVSTISKRDFVGKVRNI